MFAPELRLTVIERPRCSHCRTRMILARISTGPAGYDLRIFECEKCDEVIRKLIVSDPMEGDASGWLGGELSRPPS